jgi:ribosomal protein S18 acetylase RimI-like enzyme
MMQNAIDIRMMAVADIPAVLEIQAVCYTQITPESDVSLQAKLGASPSTCFIAAIGDDTVGYLIALPWEFSSPPMLNAETCRLPLAPDCLYLHDLAVLPGARKFGTGRALVETCLTQLKARGLERASLVAVQNSVPYWERYGFRAVLLSAPLKAKLSSYGEGVEYMELTRAQSA